MREILFRGKTYGDEEEPGEWVFGDLETHVKDQVRIVCSVKQTSDSSLYFSSMVIPETVGQYTGLKDKNEVKIFEGDIVTVNWGFMELYLTENKYDRPFAVEMRNYEYAPFSRFLPQPECITIIGNIHDNPDLLEVQDDA